MLPAEWLKLGCGNVAKSLGLATEARAGSGRRAVSSGRLNTCSIAKATSYRTLMNGKTKKIETRYGTARVSKRSLEGENNRRRVKPPLADARGTVSVILNARNPKGKYDQAVQRNNSTTHI